MSQALSVEVDFIAGARELAAQCWCDEATMSKVMDPELCEAFAKRLAAWMETAAMNSKRADTAEEKLTFLKSKGLTVGVLKEADREACLAYVIEPDSELSDTKTINKLIQTELSAKAWEDTAAQNQRNADYWRGILEQSFDELGPTFKAAACRCDDGTTADKPHLSKLPGFIKQMTEEVEWYIHGSPDQPSRLPSREENPDGLHHRYNVTRADGTRDPEAIYFVGRLDNGGKDAAHLRASRYAARVYRLIVNLDPAAEHLRKFAEELAALCCQLEPSEDAEFPGFLIGELADMLCTPYAFDIAVDYNASQEVQAEAFGAGASAAWHAKRQKFLKSHIAALLEKAEG